MTMTLLSALQQAVYTTLSADISLMAAITGIYDHVPEGAAFPYIHIGRMQTADWSTTTTTGYQVGLTLSVFTRERSNKTVLEVMDKVKAALHEAELSVSGASFTHIRFVSAELSQKPDGVTCQGMMQFRAVISG